MNGGRGKIYRYREYQPQIDPTAYIAPGAKIIGQVSVGPNSSIWHNVVVRGDIEEIKIGTGTNVQDNSVIHVAYDFHTVLGDYITVGHGAIVHGCEIGGNCLIGMGAVILNYAEIGENSIIAAGSLIPQGKKIPPNSLVMGSPGKIIRQITAEEVAKNRISAEKYIQTANEYLRGF